jgi:hypothetical protein
MHLEISQVFFFTEQIKWNGILLGMNFHFYKQLFITDFVNDENKSNSVNLWHKW